MNSAASIWLPIILGEIEKPISWLRNVATDDSSFILNNGKTVRIPNAGALPNVVIGRTSGYPVSVVDRIDSDVTYDLINFEIPPVRVSEYYEVITSYNVKESILKDQATKLAYSVIRYIFTRWYHTGNKVVTNGTVTYTSQAPNSTATVKALTYNNIVSASLILDRQAIPRDGGRYLLLNASMYNSLLQELKVSNQLELATRSAETGAVLQVHGFNVLMYPDVVNVTSNHATVRDPDATGASTDVSAGLAFHRDFVSFALSDVIVFEGESPAYYGDLVSATMFAGGNARRSDKFGVVALIEGV